MKRWTWTDYLTVVLMLMTVAICLLVFKSSATGNPNEEITRTADAIQILQPITETERARQLAKVFNTAGEENGIEPKLLVAIAMRESSLLRRAEVGEYIGAAGEGGLMQNHGISLRFRPEDCELPLIGARCQVHTGASFLNYVRGRCEGSHWVWVTAYGMSRCPSEEEGRQSPSAKIARRYYQEVGGEAWD